MTEYRLKGILSRNVNINNNECSDVQETRQDNKTRSTPTGVHPNECSDTRRPPTPVVR